MFISDISLSTAKIYLEKSRRVFSQILDPEFPNIVKQYFLYLFSVKSLHGEQVQT